MIYDHDHTGSDLLWCTEAEIDEVRSQRKKEQEPLSSDDVDRSSYEPSYGVSSVLIVGYLRSPS